MVSIIIPHFNRSALLKETINSVAEQTYKNWEIIIVDDGSGEAEFAKIKEYDNEQNIQVIQRLNGIKGPACCRNAGSKIAKGEYLLFLDSDDLLAPFCLQQRVERMEEDDIVQLGVFKMFEFNKKPGDSNTVFNKNIAGADLTGSFIRNENPWNVTCPIWRKNFFENINGFDEEMFFMEDPEIHVRAINTANAKIKLYYDYPADCYYRINHIDNTKKDFWYNSIYYRLLFYRKIITKNYHENFILENAGNIKKGMYSLIRIFLYSRKNQFPELYDDLVSLIRESKLFSFLEIVRILTLLHVGNAQWLLLKKLKLKGICYKLLPQ